MFSADTLQQALVQDYGRLCTLANKILQDSHLAQDAVQESWLRLNRARPDTTDAEKLRHLLLVTVRHTALNMRRSRRAEPAEDAVFAALPDAGPLPQEKLERSEAVRCLLAAMQALEETDRAILQLQYGQGMTGAQIAAALGLHAATVRQRSRRARQKLKQLLEQEGLTLGKNHWMNCWCRRAPPSNARIWRRWNSWNQPMCQCHLCRRCAAHPGGC